MEAYKVHYHTKLVESFATYTGIEYPEESGKLSEADDRLELARREPHPAAFMGLSLLSSLGDSARSTRWDAILVDAPLGCCHTGPGRYQSIYAAYELASSYASDGEDVTHVFVDDYERPVEGLFSQVVFAEVPVKVIARPATSKENSNLQAHFILSAANLQKRVQS